MAGVIPDNDWHSAVVVVYCNTRAMVSPGPELVEAGPRGRQILLTPSQVRYVVDTSLNGYNTNQ